VDMLWCQSTQNIGLSNIISITVVPASVTSRCLVLSSDSVFRQRKLQLSIY